MNMNFQVLYLILIKFQFNQKILKIEQKHDFPSTDLSLFFYFFLFFFTFFYFSLKILNISLLFSYFDILDSLWLSQDAYNLETDRSYCFGYILVFILLCMIYIFFSIFFKYFDSYSIFSSINLISVFKFEIYYFLIKNIILKIKGKIELIGNNFLQIDILFLIFFKLFLIIFSLF